MKELTTSGSCLINSDIGSGGTGGAVRRKFGISGAAGSVGSL